MGRWISMLTFENLQWRFNFTCRFARFVSVAANAAGTDVPVVSQIGEKGDVLAAACGHWFCAKIGENQREGDSWLLLLVPKLLAPTRSVFPRNSLPRWASLILLISPCWH